MLKNSGEFRIESKLTWEDKPEASRRENSDPRPLNFVRQKLCVRQMQTRTYH